jgi:hypothetical protein
MDYKTKYLKYKQKYLTLNKQVGGDNFYSFFYNDKRYSVVIDSLDFDKLQEEITRQTGLKKYFQKILKVDTVLNNDNFDTNNQNESTYDVYKKPNASFYTFIYNNRYSIPLPRNTALTFEILQEEIKDQVGIELNDQIIKNNDLTQTITKENFNDFGSEYTFNITKK